MTPWRPLDSGSAKHGCPWGHSVNVYLPFEHVANLPPTQATTWFLLLASQGDSVLIVAKTELKPNAIAVFPSPPFGVFVETAAGSTEATPVVLGLTELPPAGCCVLAGAEAVLGFKATDPEAVWPTPGLVAAVPFEEGAAAAL